MSYDVKCHELALHFLEGEKVECRERAADSLAHTIQKAIEDWFVEQTKPKRINMQKIVEYGMFKSMGEGEE